MSKERLEKAKKILNHIKGYGVYDGNDDIEIFEWLIEQAERVNKLETTVDFYQSALRDADRRVQELERELEEHKSKFTVKYTMSLREQNKHYREVLEFYAKERNWEDSWIITMNGQESDVPLAIDDCGYKARKALEGDSDE